MLSVRLTGRRGGWGGGDEGKTRFVYQTKGMGLSCVALCSKFHFSPEDFFFGGVWVGRGGLAWGGGGLGPPDPPLPPVDRHNPEGGRVAGHPISHTIEGDTKAIRIPKVRTGRDDTAAAVCPRSAHPSLPLPQCPPPPSPPPLYRVPITHPSIPRLLTGCAWPGPRRGLFGEAGSGHWPPCGRCRASVGWWRSPCIGSC